MATLKKTIEKKNLTPFSTDENKYTLKSMKNYETKLEILLDQ